MGDIELHPEKGINPYLTFCHRCLGESQELILVGANDGVYVDSCFESEGGPHKIIGRSKDRLCPVTGRETRLTLERRLKDGERLPSRDVCDRCKASDKAVAEGGVYWRCRDCNAMGALKAHAQLAIEVRREMKVAPPAPVGIEFSKERFCPVCGPDKERLKADIDRQLKREGEPDGPKTQDVPPPG